MTDQRQKDQAPDKRKIPVEFDAPANAEQDNDQRGAEPDASKQESAAEPGSAAEQLARLRSEKEDLAQTLVRRQADFENYRKRVERDRQEEHRRGVGRIVEELLPVLDALDRALKAYNAPQFEEYRKGMELIYRQVWDVLVRHGLERIVAEGKIFDPHFHQAIERVETPDYADDTVMEVVQDGFLYHGRVLRPSVVRVASHTGSSQSAAEGRTH